MRRALTGTTPIYVAGHTGLVGSACLRLLARRGFSRLITAGSAELDLRDRDATREFLRRHNPQVVLVAAARVGGIAVNAAEPAEFLSDNLRIQLSLLDAARELRVPRLLFLGSSCIYPRACPQPIRESALLTGPLEPTNEAYAVAKIAGLVHVRSVRREDGLPWISAMPTNLYGPHDRFDAERAHVLPALLRKFHEAVRSGADTVEVWGTGRPRREFLHVDDLAAACLTLLQHYDDDEPVNVGTGEDIAIADLARLVAATTGFTGEIRFDPSRPDGTPRKLLDVSRIRALGWRPEIGLEAGLAGTYDWYLRHQEVAV
ncbi:GDP-L-fucose synthase [Amycolatopsis sp. NBRC 101858]|uniref:GDP-L-fucose synthase family protein n=1 Tax=Amycolatopsis sp. NBRC 101858 TaxID=3032200 RepID=UPI0024A50334|nr:GDP-L-fucose synthase [Amycolatopsis sp. NBRC 101858]GLY39026.1 GDP-L-fucose synthase [Amycolatopsis sp. NBRC 101858]